MPITITLTTVVVDSFKVDRRSEMLRVDYHLETDGGERYGEGSYAEFYRNLPQTGEDPDGNDTQLGDEIYELPLQAAQELLSMIQRMEAVIETRVMT